MRFDVWDFCLRFKTGCHSEVMRRHWGIPTTSPSLPRLGTVTQSTSTSLALHIHIKICKRSFPRHSTVSWLTLAGRVVIIHVWKKRDCIHMRKMNWISTRKPLEKGKQNKRKAGYRYFCTEVKRFSPNSPPCVNGFDPFSWLDSNKSHRTRIKGLAAGKHASSLYPPASMAIL